MSKARELADAKAGRKPKPSLPASHVPDRMTKPYNPYASHSPMPQTANVPPSTAIIDERKQYQMEPARPYQPKPVAVPAIPKDVPPWEEQPKPGIAITPKLVAASLRQWSLEQEQNDPEASGWANYLAHQIHPL